jgi:hypothetical protein
MAVYYDLPHEFEELKRDINRSIAINELGYFKEASVMRMYGSLKLVISDIKGRNYANDVQIYERIFLDQQAPERWLPQVTELVEKYISEISEWTIL